MFKFYLCGSTTYLQLLFQTVGSLLSLAVQILFAIPNHVLFLGKLVSAPKSHKLKKKRRENLAWLLGLWIRGMMMILYHQSIPS
jgi:hypothetical protein